MDTTFFTDETSQDNLNSYYADRRDKSLYNRQKKRYGTPPPIAVFWNDEWNEETEDKSKNIK